MEQVALVVGEALVDVVRGRDGSERDHAGGSSANAAVAMSRLGPPGVVRERLGRRRRTAGCWPGTSADNDVRLAVDPLALARTATAVATLAEDGSASYEFDIEWRVPAVSLPEHVAPVVVVYGSIGAALAPGADDVAALVERGAGERADRVRRQRPAGDHRHRRRGRRPGRADGARWRTSSRPATRTSRRSGRVGPTREVADAPARRRAPARWW